MNERGGKSVGKNDFFTVALLLFTVVFHERTKDVNDWTRLEADIDIIYIL